MTATTTAAAALCPIPTLTVRLAPERLSLEQLEELADSMSQCVNCGGHPRDPETGRCSCSCVGDYAPAWAHAARELERRIIIAGSAMREGSVA
jgi:hypothetical protein